MNKKSFVGRLGEDLACEFLKKNGYKIIERNYHRPYGELDIIAKDKSDVLVFIEVKTISSLTKAFNYSQQIKPEENLTKSKLIKLQKTALSYSNSRLELVNENKGWRIDLIAIEFSGFGEAGLWQNYEVVDNILLTDLLKHCGIKHIKNI